MLWGSSYQIFHPTWQVRGDYRGSGELDEIASQDPIETLGALAVWDNRGGWNLMRVSLVHSLTPVTYI